MLNDLAALTPPFLVAAAFLIAAGAFVRHEMRRVKNRAESEDSDDSQRDSAGRADGNPADRRSVPRPLSTDPGDRDPGRGE